MSKSKFSSLLKFLEMNVIYMIISKKEAHKVAMKKELTKDGSNHIFSHRRIQIQYDTYNHMKSTTHRTTSLSNQRVQRKILSFHYDSDLEKF